jgi:hypothetical protein
MITDDGRGLLFVERTIEPADLARFEGTRVREVADGWLLAVSLFKVLARAFDVELVNVLEFAVSGLVVLALVAFDDPALLVGGFLGETGESKAGSIFPTSSMASSSASIASIGSSGCDSGKDGETDKLLAKG